MIKVNTAKTREALEALKEKLLFLADFTLIRGERAGLQYLARTTRFKNRTGNLRGSFQSLAESPFTRTFGVSQGFTVSKGPHPYDYGRFVENRVHFMVFARIHAENTMHRVIEERMRHVIGS